jgi:hypothetical protein
MHKVEYSLSLMARRLDEMYKSISVSRLSLSPLDTDADKFVPFVAMRRAKAVQAVGILLTVKRAVVHSAQPSSRPFREA